MKTQLELQVEEIAILSADQVACVTGGAADTARSDTVRAADTVRFADTTRDADTVRLADTV